MSFHKSNLGAFGQGIKADKNGYVPTGETEAFDLDYDHTEETHDPDGNLTEYGEWWESE